MDIEVVQRDGSSARMMIPLPSSGAPQYWIYAPPTDAADWHGQLLVWLQEEVSTGGLGSSRTRVAVGDESYVVIESYGFRSADPAKHARLAASAGPFGWNGSADRDE